MNNTLRPIACGQGVLTMAVNGDLIMSSNFKHFFKLSYPVCLRRKSRFEFLGMSSSMLPVLGIDVNAGTVQSEQVDTSEGSVWNLSILC
jgi:hypothetical protein